MCPRKEPVCISQTGSFRMLCRIGALKTRSYRPFSASTAVYLRVLRAPMRQTRVLDASLHGDSDLAPLRRDVSHRRHDRKNGSNVCGAGKLEASYSQGKTPVSNLCDGNTDTAWGDWQSKGSVKPEPWVSWTFDEAKTLDYDLSESLNIETQGVSASFAFAIASNGDQQPTAPSKPGDGDACKRLPAANRRSRRVRHSPRCAVM